MIGVRRREVRTRPFRLARTADTQFQQVKNKIHITMPIEFPEHKAGSKEPANIWVAASDGDMERVIEVSCAERIITLVLFRF